MDHSWDNSRSTIQQRTSFFKNQGITILIALSFVFFIVFIVGYFVYHNRKQLSSNLVQKEIQMAEPDWKDASIIIKALQSDSESITMYRANPKLKSQFNNEYDFLNFVTKWRPFLEPLPKTVPSQSSGNFGHGGGFGIGATTLSYKMATGCWITIKWNGPNGALGRQISGIEIYR